MGQYVLRPLDARAFASHEMLAALASLQPTARPEQRQRTVDFLAKVHGMNLTTTKSLRFDPTFTRRDGTNKQGNIRIGPTAFQQDLSWLANVIFHEVIHSDQFHYYAQHGLQFDHHEKVSEPLRVIVALDEYEGFYWPLRNSRALGLSPQQAAELQREVHLWEIEVDDQDTIALIRKQQFDAARRALIKRLPAQKAGT